MRNYEGICVLRMSEGEVLKKGLKNRRVLFLVEEFYEKLYFIAKSRIVDEE